ncbi:MAG TPA: CrpP-related protein [Burkholderiaceae bacterium]|nr:CrpP-related protein [Burkholderiaceae bacterium]
MRSGEQPLPSGQKTALAAPEDRSAEGDDSALPVGERAELQRQGAKAAARGEPPARNPLQRPQNLPKATGESQQTWSQRSDAWQQGHDAQSRGPHHATADPAGEDDQERE